MDLTPPRNIRFTYAPYTQTVWTQFVTPLLRWDGNRDTFCHMTAEEKQALRKTRQQVGSLGTAAREAKQREKSLASAQSAPPAPGEEFAIACWKDRIDKGTCDAQDVKIQILKVDLETAKAKRDTELGKLVPRDQVQEREADLGELFRDGLASLVDLVSEWAAPNKIIQAQAAFRDRADQILHTIADGAKK